MYFQQSDTLVQSARQNFVKKVYSIISLQLLATVITVYSSIHSRVFAIFLITNTWLFWTSFIGSMASLISLFFGGISRQTPINYLVMGALTLFESIMVAYACLSYDPSSVFLAAVATLSATLGLTYYAMTTRQDFTSAKYIGKGMLYSISWIVLSVSLMNFVFLRSSFLSYGLSIAFAAIYSIYLLVDTQLILGKREKRVNLDDYILGATILYVDIISLFLKLLRILGKKKDE